MCQLAFAHAGLLRYGRAPDDQPRITGRTDATAGGAWSDGAWQLSLAREGLVAGHPAGELDGARRGAAWVFSAAVAF